MSDTESERDWESLLSEPLPVLSRPLNALRRSNAVPSEAEVQAMEAFLEECEDRSYAIEDAIDTLRDRHRVLQRTMKKCRRVFSTVRRLPPDILGEIAGHIRDRSGAVVPPWEMSRVCTSWRLALTRFPSLWTALATAEGESGKLRLQVERGGNALLRVRIAPRSKEEIDSHVELIVPHTQRWGTLLLGAPDYSEFTTGRPFRREFLELILPPTATYERMSELVLCSELIPWNTFNVAATFPALRKLSMLRLSRSPLTTVFPWGQLTHFCTHVSNIDPVHVLRNAPNLIHFAANGSPSENTDQTVFTLAHLRSIYLSTEYTGLLPLLVAPALQVLAVLPWAGSRANGLSIIKPFLERSSPPLTTLVLEMGIWSIDFIDWDLDDKLVSQDLRPVLRLCPVLEYLLLYTSPGRNRETGPSAETLEPLFTALEREDGLCPRLTHLLLGVGSARRPHREGFRYDFDDYDSDTPDAGVGRAFRSMLRRRASAPVDAAYARLRYLRLGQEDKQLLEPDGFDSDEEDEAFRVPKGMDARIVQQEELVDVAVEWRGFPLDWTASIRSGY
ncbi:F-box domain-containing protein [Mycena indigotica]|uniref:F-box domain-containing protein n=1 Tax=Mycena indigotica TaxID=2126181 RepID=A0A8H6W397_9AGAR|nr:F-box domain-containing protein [Mycena indigotica]KAF7303392.1 F-box domain-containing protein [Mycena indigotica]